MTQIVVITGAPGVGKTATAQALAGRLGGTVACLCGDVFILAVVPLEFSEERRRFLRRNLVSFARHSIEHGYDWVIIECVIPEDDFIRQLQEEIGPAAEQFHAFSLPADREAYRRRLRGRSVYPDADDESFAECYQWMERIGRMTLPRPIDTTQRTAEETAEEIVRLIREAGVRTKDEG